MANTIGTAYVQIEPSTEGIAGKISSALEPEATSAGSKAGGALSSALGTAAKIGVSAIAGATAAVGAFGKASVDAGMQFDSSMSQVAATMGFSTEELNTAGSAASETFQTLRDFAQEMGSKTAFSASEAADALNYMALAGYDADTSMKMLPNVLNLAAAGGIDLASASDMVTDAQSALGLSLEETSTMVDQMAAASSKSNTSVAQLGEAFLTIGANAKNLSGGTQELSTALGILADNGIKGSEGGTHLRNILLSLTPKSEAAAEAMEQLGFKAYDADGNLRPLQDTFADLNKAMEGMTTEEKTNMLSTMFNKTDLASINALLATSADRWDELGTAIQNASGLGGMSTEGLKGMVADLQYNYERLGGDMSAFTSEMMDYLTTEYDMSETMAKQAIDMFSESIKDGTVNVDELVASYQELGGAAQNMAEVQLDNLSGDITLFESALEGAKIAVSDGLTPVLRDFVQIGSQGLSDVTKALKEEGLSGAMKSLGNTLSSLVKKVTEYLPDMVNAGMSLLKSVGDGILQNLPMLIKTGLQIILELANSISSSLPKLIPTIVDVVLEITETLIDNVDMLVDGAIALVVGLGKGLINALPRLIEKVPEIVIKLGDAVIRNAPKLVSAAIELILTLQKGLLDSIPKLLQAVPEILEGLKNSFMNGAKAMVQIGSDLVDGIKSGIQQAWEDLKSWLGDLCGGLVDKIKETLKIGSPSKIMRDEVGQWIPEGVAVGIEANADSVTEAMNGLTSDVMVAGKNIASDYSAKYSASTDYSSSNSDQIDLESIIKSAVEGVGVYMDSQRVGYLVAEPVNQAMGRLNVRRV